MGMEIIIIWFLFGIVSAVIASKKGRSGCGWFLLGVLLGPFGLILAVVASRRQGIVEKKAVQNGTMKKCPYCAELIKVEAVKCRFCGEEQVSSEPSDSLMAVDTIAFTGEDRPKIQEEERYGAKTGEKVEKRKRVGFVPLLLIVLVVLSVIGYIVSRTSSPPKKIERQTIAGKLEKEKSDEFTNAIEDHYQKLVDFYNNGELKEASYQLDLFEENKKLDYKNVRDIYNKVMIKVLDDKVRKIPVAESQKNLDIYKQLLSLDPQNERYQKKVAFYATKVEAQRRKRERERALRDFSNALRIVDSRWTTTGFGAVAEWTVVIENISPNSSFKDIKFKTVYWAESGTKVDESILGHTEYTIIRPKSKKKIVFTEFMHSQAHTASIKIINAKRLEP